MGGESDRIHYFDTCCVDVVGYTSNRWRIDTI